MALVDWKVIEQKAIEFSKNWNTATNEKQQAQSFMIEFYRVFGVDIIRANNNAVLLRNKYLNSILVHWYNSFISHGMITHSPLLFHGTPILVPVLS